MSQPLEVTHIQPERWSQYVGHDVTVMVTETGRTYAIVGNPYTCYIDPASGAYLNQAQNFIKWWKALSEKNNKSNE